MRAFCPENWQVNVKKVGFEGILFLSYDKYGRKIITFSIYCQEMRLIEISETDGVIQVKLFITGAWYKTINYPNRTCLHRFIINGRDRLFATNLPLIF